MTQKEQTFKSFILVGNVQITGQNALDLAIVPCLQPGLMLCEVCSNKMLFDNENQKNAKNSQGKISSQTTFSSASDYMDPLLEADASLGIVNQILTSLQISPVKPDTKQSEEKRLILIKRKTEELTTAVCEELSSALCVSSENLPINYSLTELLKIANDFSHMLEEWKGRVNHAETYADKVQMLTGFLPPSWTIEKLASEFGVSKRVIASANEMKSENGIIPEKRKSEPEIVFRNRQFQLLISFTTTKL